MNCSTKCDELSPVTFMASFINDEALKKDGEVIERLHGLEVGIDEAKLLVRQTQSKVKELEALLSNMKQKQEVERGTPTNVNEPVERPSTSGF